MTQIQQISGYRRPLAPLKCVPLLKNPKNQKHTPLFWDATNPLPSFSVSHPPSKSSTPGPGHLVAASTSAAWPKDSSPRKRLRHLKSGASASMDGVVEQPCSISMAGETIHGGKRCWFFSNDKMGGQTNLQSTQKCYAFVPWGSLNPTCLEGFYGI